MAEQAESTLQELAQDLEGTPEEEQAEVEDTPVEEQVKTLDEDMVHELGLPKEMVGKPISEAGRSYKELRKALQEKGTELNQIRTAMENNATTKQEKQEVKDIFDRMPDPVDEFEEYKVWQKELVKEIKTDALAEFKKQLEPLQSEVQSRQEREFLNTLQNKLPEGIDAKEAIQDWAKNSGDIEDEDDQQYYLKKPSKMMDKIADYYEKRSSKEAEVKGKKKKGDEMVNRISKSLNKSDVKPSAHNSNARTQKTDTPDVLLEIIDEEMKKT